MAITAAEIHDMSFSIDRKGYDVDEVDVFLEHVADEIDAMNNQIVQLEGQMGESEFDGFDTPARIEPEETNDELAASLAEKEAALAEKEASLVKKDELIADLERQLEAKKADDKAIAQALIIAQRSADDILTNANAQASDIIQDAKDEAEHIMDQVENEKQEVLDAIKKLEDDREDTREEYQDLLKDFIGDATRKLAEIGGSDLPSSNYSSAHARSTVVDRKSSSAATTGRVMSSAQAPINADANPSYSTPQAAGVVVTPATPKPSSVEKDLSGFGDADDGFEFEAID